MSEYDGRLECGNCRFWRPDAQTLSSGECWRYPPEVVGTPLVAPTIHGAKPKVDWLIQSIRPPVGAKAPACGEFQSRPEIVN